MFLLFATAASAGTTDISVSVHSYLLEASSVICKNPSCSDNALISFILLELVLVLLCSLNYMFHSRQVTLSSIICMHLSLQDELVDTLPNVTTLS